MATREAIAIRQEKANDRLEKALKRLYTETGVRAKKIELTERDTTARMAELSEKLADMVEDLLSVVVSDGEPDEDAEDDNVADEVAKRTLGIEGEEETEPTRQPGDIVEDPETPQKGQDQEVQDSEVEDIEPITADELAEVDTVEEEDDGDTDAGTGSGKARSAAKKLKATSSSTRRN
jgi:disulfide oxidoreductase YuzD